MERTKKEKALKNRIVTAAWQLFHEEAITVLPWMISLLCLVHQRDHFIGTSIPKMNCSILFVCDWTISEKNWKAE